MLKSKLGAKVFQVITGATIDTWTTYLSTSKDAAIIFLIFS